jgi:hypothetical protein
MKLSTFLIAFCPPLTVLIAKTALEPDWLKDVSWPVCIALGLFFGVAAGFAAHAWDPDDN